MMNSRATRKVSLTRKITLFQNNQLYEINELFPFFCMEKILKKSLSQYLMKNKALLKTNS